jgi:FtsJ-like methyltransferase
VAIYYVLHVPLVLMYRSLHDVIKEQDLLSKGSRLPSDSQPGANLTWAIEVEKTHNDRLLALFKSVCDKSVLLVSVRGNASGTVANNATNYKSKRNTSVVARFSSFIFSSINMVTDTKLPPEAFRSVHRMFHIPYSCHDPISILGHPAFMSLIISAPSESETRSSAEAKNSADFKLLNGDNNHAITLKVQTSPKKLANHLIEMIKSELKFKYLKLISFENFQDCEGDSFNVKVDVKGKSSINDCQRCTAVNNHENTSESTRENTGERGERSGTNSSIDKGDALAPAVGDEVGPRHAHTHLLQCIYGADDGIFRWGIATTECSVRNRLTAESIEFEIENERQKRFKRDDVSRDERTRGVRIVADGDSDRNFVKGQGQGHCVDFDTVLEGEMCQGNASDRPVSSSSSSSSNNNDGSSNSISSSTSSSSSNNGGSSNNTSSNNTSSTNDSSDVSPSLHCPPVDQILQEEQNILSNVTKSSSSGSSSFTPASRAYYKMSEIKEFYFPLWGWTWPGDDVEGDSSVRNNDNDNGEANCTSNDCDSVPPQNDDTDGNKISENIRSKSLLKSRNRRKSRVSGDCCAVDIGSSPGGWTQCLAAHCVHVISVDPGE